jgi:hypothetical protein
VDLGVAGPVDSKECQLVQDLYERLLPDEAERAHDQNYRERLAEILPLAYEAVQKDRYDATHTNFQAHLNEREPAGAWRTSQINL